MAISQNNVKCPRCKGEFDKAKKFNMMFKVGIGPQDEEAYLRPENLSVNLCRFSKIIQDNERETSFRNCSSRKKFSEMR